MIAAWTTPSHHTASAAAAPCERVRERTPRCAPPSSSPSWTRCWTAYGARRVGSAECSRRCTARPDPRVRRLFSHLTPELLRNSEQLGDRLGQVRARARCCGLPVALLMRPPGVANGGAQAAKGTLTQLRCAGHRRQHRQAQAGGDQRQGQCGERRAHTLGAGPLAQVQGERVGIAGLRAEWGRGLHPHAGPGAHIGSLHVPARGTHACVAGALSGSTRMIP